jgi:sigma-E factor negative regulatory protein RseA
MDTIETNRQHVSSLADGALRGEAFSQAVRVTALTQDARETWHAYHLIGDVLRSNDLAQCAARSDFMSRLQARLAEEPAHGQVPALIQAHRFETVTGKQEAANASVFRWKLFAGVASCVAVAAVGWNLLGAAMPSTGSGAVMAGAASSAVAVASGTASAGDAGNASQVMIRDPHLDALLAAHKQFGGTSALQGPAGFLRNATFETSGR